MDTTTPDRFANFERLAVDVGKVASRERLHYRCRQTFKGIDLAGKTVLEIGAGAGVYSAFAAVSGAKQVVSLEPEGDGSTKGYTSAIHQIAHGLDLPNWSVHNQTIQDYDNQGAIFDVVLLHYSINHLNEPACIELKSSPQARQVYLDLFTKISAMMAPGATLIIADASRYNFWPMVRLPNPAIGCIEWHKHQSPRTWTNLLKPIGFAPQGVRWYRYYELRMLGPLAGNAIAAFFLTSHFRLVMTKR